jgi:hypothetical protein
MRSLRLLPKISSYKVSLLSGTMTLGLCSTICASSCGRLNLSIKIFKISTLAF